MQNRCGMVACDIGSSTGGFVDYLIQNGVKKVYAIDVNNERVIKIEKNA